ncbi:MAG TPA: D-alanine--D-alanine ligase, partial [Isosphaeraceae bacterium]|nr:D-alanine--D-alanine ligase [Isosphaeraceae bacterium]
MSEAGTRVVVLFNAPALPPEHPDSRSEADVVGVAQGVAEVLCQRGFQAVPLPAAPPVEELATRLAGAKPDLVFNLVEGFAGSSGGEAHLTSLIELFGYPYTGCPPEAQALCRRKAATKALLRGYGLPTAPFTVARADRPLPDLEGAGPWIVKPESEDASLGIDQHSVVTEPAEVAERVRQLGLAYGPRVLIEAYLPGPEYNVGILGLPHPQALAIAEVLYRVEPGAWPILTYAAKWNEGSAEDRASPIGCPARIAPEIAARLETLAVRAFEATGCRDYARVDFRLDAQGEPMILEVNPNPDI